MLLRPARPHLRGGVVNCFAFKASVALVTVMLAVGIPVRSHPTRSDQFVAPIDTATPSQWFELFERQDFKFLAVVSFVVTYSATDQTWPVPSDWSNASNSAEVISHSGTGASGTSGAGGNGGGGGGGGAYSITAANMTLTPGGSATYRLRDTGAGNADANACWFNGTSLAGSSVGVRGGSNAAAATAGAGALTTNGIGTRVAGGNGANGVTASGNQAGGGGGGAGGLHGAGGNASGTTGGTGDNGTTAAGANGTQYDATHGSGGGGAGGAAGANAGSNGGQYGGAAGGGGKSNGAGAAAGTSRGGLIVVTYTPSFSRVPTFFFVP